MLSAGSFTTSTPIHEQHDSGFYDNSPLSGNLSLTTAEESNLLLRKNLFGKRSNSENIPDNQFKNKHKLFLRSSPFLRRDPISNKETPRTSRSCAASDKLVHFEEVKTPKQLKQLILNSNNPPLKPCDKDSGFCEETPEKSLNPKSECCGFPLLSLVENFHQREESLEYFKHCLTFYEAKNCADLSTSEILNLYSIYRFQRTGLKPAAVDIAFSEKQFLTKEINKEHKMFLLSWKNRLERISADINMPKKYDFLSHLYKMNALSIVYKILSYLSGYDLQNVSCVSQMWRKIVLEDKITNGKRWAYFKEMQKLKEEMEQKKLARPQNFRILESSENIQREQIQLNKTIKEINFDAFIKVGKSEKHKPMKCPSCCNLSLQNKQVITKYNCLFCGYEFCCNCLKPYTNWHFCASTYLPVKMPPANGKKYLRRL